MLMNDFKEESCTSRLLQLFEGRKQKRKVELNEEKNGKKRTITFSVGLSNPFFAEML